MINTKQGDDIMQQIRKTTTIKTLVILVILAVFLFAGISITTVAAQASIPGDALYPVKTTIEQTRLNLSRDAGNRAQMHMGFAEQRLGEISQLIQEGRYREIGPAVLAFEENINNAIIELETVAQGDPARAARLALDVASALTRYARTLSVMAASAPESVKNEVFRALDSTQIASGLEMPTGDDHGNDNTNVNANDNANINNNDNGDDHGNDNANLNNNDNGDDRGNDNANLNNNDNGDDHGNDNANINNNDNGDDHGNDNANINNNDNGDDNGGGGDNSHDDHSGKDGKKGKDN
jgi:hypothetical protein